MSVVHKNDQSNAPSEARSRERVFHQVSIGYSTALSTPSPSVTKTPLRHWFGTLVNISQSGLCFNARGTFDEGQIISLFLKLSDSSSGITMLGKIIWIEQLEVEETAPFKDNVRLGVRFIGSLPTDWQKILSTQVD
jgi:hypothetical protein